MRPRRARWRGWRWIKRGALGAVAVVVIAVVAAIVAVHTDWGREILRARVEHQLRTTFIGGASLGRIEGSPFGELTLHDVVIHGPDRRPALRDVWAAPTEGWNWAAGVSQGWFGIEAIVQEPLLMIGPIWLPGGTTNTRSVTLGRPFSSRKLTSASPTASSVMAVSTSSLGLYVSNGAPRGTAIT